MKKEISDIIEKFKKIYPQSQTEQIKIVRAPARVNLIGEHTDYNEGYVLPVAINKEIIAIGRKKENNEVILHSLNFPNSVKFNLDAIKHNKEDVWGNYPKGVLSELKKYRYSFSGIEGLYSGNIPIASGISSSAAIEIATLYLYQILFKLKIHPMKMIRMAHSAENEFVGVKCGIMDQFVSVLGKSDCALFIDCRNLDYEILPLSFSDVSLVVCNTKVKRELAYSEYNLRRFQTQEATKFLQKYIKIKSLRDVEINDFEKLKNKLPEVLKKRAKHIIYENERVIKSVKLLKEKKLEEFGELLYQSHQSLKEDYQVSCEELDIIVDLAKKQKGTLGAKMTGAGFGGCAIAIVKKENIEEMTKNIENEYHNKTKIKPEIYICNIVNGAEEINYEN